METLSVTDTSDVSEASASGQTLWHLPPKACSVTGFLGPQVAAELLDRILAVPVDTLRTSALAGGKIHPQIRRSLTGRDFRAPELEAALLDVLGDVEQAVGIPCGDVELDYTLAVHNDGDFYRRHQDRGSISSDRLVTFVYYLHRTPRPFTGGQLRIFDRLAPAGDPSAPDEADTWRDWEPEHDSVVFFDPSAYHEVRPVDCPSRAHADSRFTLTGWFYPLGSGR